VNYINPKVPRIIFWIINLLHYLLAIFSSTELRAGWSGVQFPAVAENISRHHSVQIGSGTHPAFYPMGARGSFPGDKSSGGVQLTTHLHLVPRSRMRGAIPPLAQYASKCGAQLNTGTTLPLPLPLYLSLTALYLGIYNLYSCLKVRDRFPHP
jgi:hypothetical protein